MADVKQILVVDDHFEMLEFLRSMLELSNRDYQVLGVPSAEEGFLELRRTPFDLLITDVRLPGMSGFELVRKVRKVRPELPIIMITAYSAPKGKQEAEELNVFRYFAKPLDTDDLLAAVHAALHQDKLPQAPLPAESSNEQQTDGLVADSVRDCMQSLMSDTGAAQVVLADRNGSILLRIGGYRALDLDRLAEMVAEGLDNSFRIAAQLQSEELFTIQYQAGQKVDLYTANVGRAYFIMLLFDGQARRGRIGTVWIFAQRTIKELNGMLPSVPPKANSVAVVETEEAVAVREQPEPGDPHLEEAKLRVRVDDGLEGQSAEPETLETEQPVVESEAEAYVEDEAFDEEFALAMEDLPLLDMLEDPLEGQELDLDAFWDDATSEEANAKNMTGLTFEEAMRRGLLPPEFDDADDSN